MNTSNELYLKNKINELKIELYKAMTSNIKLIGLLTEEKKNHKKDLEKLVETLKELDTYKSKFDVSEENNPIMWKDAESFYKSQEYNNERIDT